MTDPTPANRPSAYQGATADRAAPADHADVLARVKAVMRRDLKLGADFPIPDDMAFFGGEADIDSLDVLLLLGSIEKEFGIKIPNEAVGRQVFQSVQTLVGYVQEQLAQEAGGPTAGAAGPAGGGDPLARLPHGPEFRFVTRVVGVRPGESAEAVWAPDGSEPFFAGHFPGRPIVPGVLIAESMAQVSGLAVQTGNQAMDGKLVQVDVRFEQPVVPPAEILVRSQMVRSVGGLSQFSVTASVGSIVVARGTVTLNLSPIESAPVGGRCRPGQGPHSGHSRAEVGRVLLAASVPDVKDAPVTWINTARSN